MLFGICGWGLRNQGNEYWIYGLQFGDDQVHYSVCSFSNCCYSFHQINKLDILRKYYFVHCALVEMKLIVPLFFDINLKKKNNKIWKNKKKKIVEI